MSPLPHPKHALESGYQRPAIAIIFILPLLLATIAPAGTPKCVIYDKIALLGDQAPGTAPGVYFSSFTTPLNHSIMAPRIDAQGRAAFIALIAGPGVDPSNQSAIWSELGGALQLVVRTGMQAPGTPPGVVFTGVPSEYLPFPPSFAAGFAVFQGTLAGPGVDSTNNQGVWIGQPGSLELVARRSDPAPGTGPGVNFGSLFGEADRSGHASIRGNVIGAGVVTSNNEAVWSDRSGSLDLIVREGDPAPGTGGLVFAKGQLGSPSSVFTFAIPNGNSQLALRASLGGVGVTSFNDEALFIENAGQLGLLVREGDPAPGLAPGVTFGGNSVAFSMNSVSFNDAGRVGFNCRLGGNIPTTTAMFSDYTGVLDAVAVPGDPAPGTNFNFSIFSSPVINNANQLAFTAAAPDDDNDPFTPPPFGIFWTQPGTLLPLILPGDPVVHESTIFTLIGTSGIVGFNAAGALVFTGALDDPQTGYTASLMLADANGDVSVVARTNSLFDVIGDGSDLRTIQRIISGGFSETGAVVFRLDFTDGSSGHFKAKLASSPIPGDLNGDGQVDPADTPLFVAALLGQTTPGACENPADVNADGDTNGLDVQGFLVTLLE